MNRALYWVEGESLYVGEQAITSHCVITLHADREAVIRNEGSKTSEILMLQGRPIKEQVAQQGPFVMNSEAEIRTAFDDYRWDQNRSTKPCIRYGDYQA